MAGATLIASGARSTKQMGVGIGQAQKIATGESWKEAGL